MKVSVPKLPSKRIPSLWTHNNRVKDANSPNRTTITLNVPEHSFQRRSNPSNIFVRTLTSYEVPQSTTSNMSVLGATTRKMQKLYEQGYYAAIETEWKKFTNAGWLPDGVMFGVIMKVYAKMGQIDKIKSMWRRMRFDGITPGWHHYLAKIQCLCEIRNMEAAEQTLTEMTIDGLPPDAEIYTTLIKGYANADPMSPRPQEIYSKMVQENIVTPATCTAMMLLYGRHGMQQADIFYQQLRGEKRIIPDDPSIYNALIVVCGATGNQDSIEMYLKEMEQAGVKKNHWTYRSLMKAYASSPTSYSKFLEVFEEYRAFGAQPEDYSHYVSRIAAMGEFQDLKKALETFQKDGIPYTVDMFNHIFDTLKKNEKWDTVEQVLDLMKQYRVPRNIRTYNIIMSGYGWCGKIPQMIQTFEQMRLEFQPDSYTLCTLMERCYHHHQYSQAVTFYYFARARMIYVPRQTIAHVVVSAVLSSQWSDVHKIMEEHNFSRLIYGPMVNALDHFGPEWNMKLLTTVQLSLPCAKWLLVYYARKQRINEALDVIEHVLSNHASFMPGSKRDTWSLFFEEMQRLQQAMLSANHPDIPYIRDAIRDFTLIVIPPPPPPPQPTYPTAVQQWEHSLGLQAQEPQGEALLEYEGQANIPLEYEGQANIPLEPEDEEEYEEEE